MYQTSSSQCEDVVWILHSVSKERLPTVLTGENLTVGVDKPVKLSLLFSSVKHMHAANANAATMYLLM